MSTEPRFEIGTDYDGSDSRHHQINEVRVFENDKVSRIFMPECGVFYTESMLIRNINTGELLVRGTHYDLSIMDAVATNKSGKEVCGVVVITDNDIGGVILEYQHVGGLHATGYYILEQLIKMYPAGTGGVISYYDLINIPDEFDPAYHTMHVHDHYGTDSLLIRIERLRQQIIAKYSGTFNKLFDTAQETIDKLYVDLSDKGDQILKDIAETLTKLLVQSDEYILTDSEENPYVKRKYGEWELVTDQILHGVGGKIVIVGHGGTVGIGTEQIIRNCYIWKNIQNTINPLTPTFNISSDKNPVYSGDEINFTVTCTNIPDGTEIKWAITKVTGDDSIAANYQVPNVSVVKDGKFVANVKTIKSSFRSSNRSYNFYLVDAADASFTFMVADKTTTNSTDAIGFVNILNKNIASVGEDERFKLSVTATQGYGRTAYLKWVFGDGLSQDDFVEELPASIAISHEANYLEIETRGNLKENDNRLLTVYLLSYVDEEVSASTPVAHLEIRDTSKSFEGAIKFYNPEGLLIETTDEGSDFKIRLETNGGAGREVTFQYRSSKLLSEFVGLAETGIVESNNRIEFDASVLADFITNEALAFLEVTAIYDGLVVAVGKLSINDTYKTPDFNVSFSSKSDGSDSITVAEDGDTFYAIIQVPGWVSSKNAPQLDLKLDYTGLTTMDERFTYPPEYESVMFSAGNSADGILWINNNTLAVEIKAKAIKSLFGTGVLKLNWKMSRSNDFTVGPSLTVLNTSVPTITATPSSSQTSLIPITQVNEMTQMGDDSIFYMWLEFDGDVGSYDNLRIDFAPESQASQADLVTVFPQKIVVDGTGTKQVLTCTVNADFITEGDEKLILRGLADNVDTEVFRTEILIKDNAIRTNLTIRVSTAAGSYTPPTGPLSEWDTAYIMLDYVAYAFDTTVELTATQSAYFANFPKTITLPAGTSSKVVELNVGEGRREDGKNLIQTLTGVRKHSGKTMTNTATITIEYVNDKVFPYFTYHYVSESPSHPGTVVTQFEEGKTYYIHASVACSFAGQITVANILANATNGSGADINNRINDSTNNIVLAKPTKSTKEAIPVTGKFHVIANRSTDVKNDVKVVTAINWTTTHADVEVGSYVSIDVTETASSQRNSVIEGTLIDRSKTPVFNSVQYLSASGVEIDNIDEGEEIIYRVTMSQMTPGDRWVVVHDTSTGVTADRYLPNEFDTVERIVPNTFMDGDTFTAEWRHTIVANQKVDIYNNATFKLKNLETGKLFPANKSYKINDTSLPTNMTTKWVDADDNEITYIEEGKTATLVCQLEQVNNNTRATFTRTTGRDPAEMQSPTDYDTTKLIPANGEIRFNFTPRENHKTDTINTINGIVTLDKTANFSTSVELMVVDSSQNGIVQYYISTDEAGANEFVGNFVEGSTYYLQIYCPNLQPGNVVLVLDESSHPQLEGGVTLLNSSFILNENLKGSSAFTVASAIESQIPYGDVNSVVFIFGGDQFSEDVRSKTYYISHSNGGANVFKSITWKHMVNGVMTNVSSSSKVQEGEVVYAYVQLKPTHPNIPVTAAIDYSSSSEYSNGIKRFELNENTVVVDDNFLAIFSVTTYKDFNTLSEQYYNTLAVNFTCHGNTYRAVASMDDNSKLPQLTSSYWSSNPAGTDVLTEVTFGSTFYLIVKTLNIGADPEIQMTLNCAGTTLPQYYLSWGSVEGTQPVSVIDYVSATGEAHVAVGYTVVDDPTPIISTPADGYYHATDAVKLSEIVIGPGETLFVCVGAGDGGFADCYGANGWSYAGPVSTYHNIFKPGVTPVHSSDQATATKAITHYGSATVQLNNNIVDNTLVNVGPSWVSGYYSEASEGGDDYLDNYFGGENGSATVNSYAGLEITQICKGYFDSKLDKPLTMHVIESTTSTDTNNGAMVELLIKNTTAASMTLPVVLNDSTAKANTWDVLGTPGYIYVVNETLGAVGARVPLLNIINPFRNSNGGVAGVRLTNTYTATPPAYYQIRISTEGQTWYTLSNIRILALGTVGNTDWGTLTTAQKSAIANAANIGYLVSATDVERVYRIDSAVSGFDIIGSSSTQVNCACYISAHRSDGSVIDTSAAMYIGLRNDHGGTAI